MSVHKHHPLLVLRRNAHWLLALPMLACVLVLIWTMVASR